MKKTIMLAFATLMFSAATAMAVPYLSTDGGATVFTGNLTLVPGNEAFVEVFDSSPPAYLTALYRLSINLFEYYSPAPEGTISGAMHGASFSPPVFSVESPHSVDLFSMNFNDFGGPPLSLAQFNLDFTAPGRILLTVGGTYVSLDPENVSRFTGFSSDTLLNVTESTAPVPTPEPSTIALLGTGLGMLSFIAVRARKRSA